MENNWILLLISFLVALFISIQFLKRFIQFSKKKSWLDLPDERKKHLAPTPSSGGIVFGILALLLIPFIIHSVPYLVVIISALFLMAVGFYDDCNDISARIKFALQTVAIIVSLAVIGPLNLIENNPLFLNEILTFLFVLGFTNSFNLIDGVDGLAGSYALVVLTIITFIFLMSFNFTGALITSTLVAGLIGFLKFNWNPAKIFMGDTGSLFLGFFISIFAVIAVNSLGTSIAETIAPKQLQLFLISLLLLPMMDTVRVMSARMINGNPPFKADRSHLHHILMKIGFSAKGVSYFFFLTTLLLISSSSILIYLQFEFAFILLTLIAAMMLLFYTVLVIRMQQHKLRMKRYQNSLNHIVEKNQLMHQSAIHLLKNRKNEKNIPVRR